MKNRSIKERHYHVHNESPDKVESVNMKSSGFTNIIGEKYNGMLACYHLHVDPQLSINKAALRRIPCACDSCVNKLSLRWIDNVEAEFQPRFSQIIHVNILIFLVITMIG